MAYDPERFHAAYLRGAELPLPIGLPGWQITRVSSDRQRHAIDLLLRGPGGAELLVFVERLVEGASSAARTSLLQLSYYDDNHVPTVEAGHALRALAAVLGAVERRIGEPAARAALHRAVEPVLSELELRINRECNEECVFCNTPADSESILPGRAQILEAIDLEFDKGYRRITFTGREPTLDPSLLDYVRAAKSRGYPTITVASNGTTYAHKPTLAALVEAGMTATKLSLHPGGAVGQPPHHLADGARGRRPAARRSPPAAHRSRRAAPPWPRRRRRAWHPRRGPAPLRRPALRDACGLRAPQP
jgi:hypothetical protein